MSARAVTSKRSIAVAIGAFVVAAALFAVAFFALDGMSVVKGLLGKGSLSERLSALGFKSGSAEHKELELPAKMPSEFALRLWQEQLDSQENISRLISGYVESLAIEKVDRSGDKALLHVRAAFADGSTLPGVIGMRKYGGSWYIHYITGFRSGVGTANLDPPESPLPDISTVDVALLNTVLKEQSYSRNVTEEYVAGIVKKIYIQDVVKGPGTVTLKVEMAETHGEGYAQLVLLERNVDGRRKYFFARFIKTGHNPPNL